MNDKSDLLGQLRIDRAAVPSSPSRWPWIVGGSVLALAGLALAARWLAGPDAIPVSVVSARAASAGAGPASVLDASGYVVARRQATVSSKVTGKVTEVLIEEGQRVAAGEVLARIDDSNVRAAQALAASQLEAARAQLAEVRVQLAEAERQLVRQRELAAKNLVSQQSLDSAQASVDTLRARLESTQRSVTVAERSVDVQSRQLDDTVVRAPFAGVITVKNAQPGEMISPLSAGGAGTRTGIGTLVDMDSLEIEVDVNENFINRVQPGQPASARLNAYPDWDIPARVIAVIPTADRSKATVKVRVGFDKGDPRILPDMGVRVSFRETREADASAPRVAGVWVPPEAVQASGDNGVVYVVRGETVERRAVRLAGRTPDGVRVVSGLAGGEQLAAGALDRLSDGATIEVVQP